VRLGLRQMPLQRERCDGEENRRSKGDAQQGQPCFQ
jgi:hypothetical protein